jgi:hypothetical protein
VSGVVNSARRLGAQILAILEPVIVRLAPLVEKLADVLAGVADKVAQFSANVFGFDLYTKAEKGNYDFAESMDEAANSASNATKKTKEYENTVLGFDQLNKLNGDNSSSDTTSAQLEQLETQSNAWNDIAKSIWDAYKQGDWENMGKNMATGLNYLFAHLGAKFGWDLNSDKITEKLKNFTTVLNSFVKNIDAQQIGFAIGDIANTLINSLDYLLNDPEGKIDFSTLGEKIGQLFASAITKINWQGVGRVLVGALRGFGDMLRSALTTTIKDAEGNDITLGTALGNALHDMLKGAVELFDPEHFSDVLAAIINAFNDLIIALTSDPELFGTLGTKLADSINLLGKKIDQGKMSTAFQQLFTSIGSLLGNFFGGIDWGSLGETIGNAIGSDAGSLLLVGLLGALLGKKLGIGGIGGALLALLIGGNLGNLGDIGNLFGNNKNKNKNKNKSDTTIGVNTQYTEGLASGALLLKAVKTALTNPLLGASMIGGGWLGQHLWKAGAGLGFNDLTNNLKKEWGSVENYKAITGRDWYENLDELLADLAWSKNGLSFKSGSRGAMYLSPKAYEAINAGVWDEESQVYLARNDANKERIAEIEAEHAQRMSDLNAVYADIVAELKMYGYNDALSRGEIAGNVMNSIKARMAETGDGVTSFDIHKEVADALGIEVANTEKIAQQTENIDKMVEANSSLIEAIKNGDKELVVKIGETTIQRAFLTVLGQFSKQYGQSL